MYYLHGVTKDAKYYVCWCLKALEHAYRQVTN